jgi:hypothetical protein
MKPVKIMVDVQGGPCVNEGWVIAQGDDLAAIEIDLLTKRCVVECTACIPYGETGQLIPSVVIGADENTLHIDEDLRDSPTHIVFPEYAGWRVWAADIARYTLSLCLIREVVFNGEKDEESTR